jgi:hypothetical protein
VVSNLWIFYCIDGEVCILYWLFLLTSLYLFWDRYFFVSDFLLFF